MRWHRLAALARKEVIQIRRDPRSLIMVVVMPLMLMLLFGYGVTLDIKHIAVFAFDREGSQQSQDLLRRFQASEYFDLVETVDNYPALVAAIDAGRCQLGLVIPHDFSQRLRVGGPVAVQALVDATDDNTANLIFSYSETVIRDFSQEIQLDWGERQGRSQVQPVLRVEPRTWFNEDLESKAFIVPGVVAIVMAVIGTFLTSLTVAREWERGTMEQLISTPVTPLEVMLGKLVPYFAIGLFDTALCAVVAIGWFQVPFRGGLSALFGSSALFLVVVLGVGFFISVVAKTQLTASQLALVATFLPAFLLSGFIFSIEQMPAVIQTITYTVPARYYMAILKSVFLQGTTVAARRGDFLALVIFAVIVAGLATRAFHKRLG
ncbi:MAG: ABC transporter permease [Terriglobia bacterium]